MIIPVRNRGRRLSSRPFYSVVFLLSILIAYSFLVRFNRQPSHDAAHTLLTKRNTEPECNQVHQADDQCAFVKQYCADDDAGLIPYLTLYYCRFGQVKPFALAALVLWIALLFTTIGIAASDFFSVNLSTIATILGLSESLAGVTFLAFGNGSPDVFSTFAAMGSNSASMAMGELIGAACFITGVVAGSMALVREFRVDKKTYARDICFFIVAIAFTMYFLADGHLRFWECCAMIVYYLIYVVTVVGQHWYTTQRKRRLRREGEARSHVYGPVGTSVDELAGEPYRDDPDDVDQTPPPHPDIAALERGPRIEIEGRPTTPRPEDAEASDEDMERVVAAEVASSMRVLRTRGKRRNTLNPIRPSLVGALEFRSALAHLQRESNLKLSTLHGHGRSYSEAHLQNRARSRSTDVPQLSPYTISSPDELPGNRVRALSSGNPPTSLSVPQSLLEPTTGAQLDPNLPGHRSPSPAQSYKLGGNLAPPPIDPSTGGSATPAEGVANTNKPSDELRLSIPSSSRRSSNSGASSPSSPFPLYTDSPGMMTPLPHSERSEMTLPGPALLDRAFADLPVSRDEPRPVSWWPYSMLPPPHVLFATLFPTLQGWKDKTVWDKFVSTISVPTIFLLVITLPVVETDSVDDEEEATPVIPEIRPVPPPVLVEPAPDEPETEWQRYRRRTITRSHSYQSSGDISPMRVPLENEDTLVAEPHADGARPTSSMSGKPASEIPSVSMANDETLSWNRWLVCVQIFTGPLFSVVILWANIREDLDSPGKTLTRMILFTLLGSLLLLGLLLMSTSEDRRPKYHHVLCFMGFIISIAWISTIAGEVVGVLKTLGVVLGISEALLGLTIFAAGNSVGDLIADITVARLGYPVMALSACFGGPMLNILLGIGIGGVFMMVQKASHDHKANPDEPWQYGPYEVRVGGTLFISAITLLVTLVGLLIFVPLNKWILSRRIGWTLIVLWAVTTLVNVIIEVTGALGQLE